MLCPQPPAEKHERSLNILGRPILSPERRFVGPIWTGESVSTLSSIAKLLLIPPTQFVSSKNEEQLNTPAIAHATRSDEGGQRSQRHKSFSIFTTHHRREIINTR
ncbi:serine/threonine-protein kinase DCLK3 [Striga asiatica]|uniref:Serine/threonine-protein kinase DCLK3 n=1 Tax=Striga asiatica TaxID=4170 RepID=A0A5A7QY17_STRAF|nr:serine/threonine-protein kinase DCLK3 [Striga asiatica]